MDHRICSTLPWYKATNIVVVTSNIVVVTDNIVVLISKFPDLVPALIQTLSASILIALTLTLAIKSHISILTIIN
jgi:hypothetical protein